MKEKNMKCSNFVVYRINKKGKKLVNRQKVKAWGFSEILNGKMSEDYEVCSGNITVLIEAIDEPNWGGSCATLGITYICDNCGQASCPELPSNKDDLTDFMNNTLNEMTEKGAKSLKDKYADEQKEYNQLLAKSRELYKKNKELKNKKSKQIRNL